MRHLTLWLALGLSLAFALPSFAIEVTQGETVRLQLKLVNTGEVSLEQVRIQWEETPNWLKPLPSVFHVSVPIYATTTLPVGFQVDAEAPIIQDVLVRFTLIDREGSRWPQQIMFSVLKRPKPERTQVFQNFPNPFNPETWIPYQLAEAADVTIRIYDLSGRLVHNLKLGRQEAGWYTSRDKAAYWDGRNELGETVASGIYFYYLQAGSFSAIRRLLVIR